MSDAPVLSVVVPAFEVEQYLDECVHSIITSEVDLEVLVVVDPSSDATGRIARSWESRSARVRVIENDDRRGPGSSRNAGLHAARGTYVAFVDSDDVVPAGAFEAAIASLEDTGSDFCTGRADEFRTDGTRTTYWTQRFSVFDEGARRTTLTGHPELIWDHTAWAKVFRRSFLLDHGILWPEGVLCEDVVPATTAYVTAATVDVLPQCVYLYRRRAGSITGRLTATESLADWAEQTGRALEILSASGLPGALELAAEKVLRHEAPNRVRALGPSVDPATASAVRECVDAAVLAAGPAVLNRVPIEAMRTVRDGLPEASRGFRAVSEALGETVRAGTDRETKAGRNGLVSVVIPTYNVEPWIDECLQSVLDQDYPALEIIVVDDRSTDGTWERLQEYVARDSRIRAVRNPGVGGAQARNAGVELAAGEYLAFADGDDVIALHAYRRLVDRLEAHDADVAIGSFQKIWATGTWRADGYGLEAEVPATTLLHHPRIIRNRTCWNKLVRREFWDRHGFRFPTAPRANDIVPVTRMLDAAERITILPDVVYHYRARPGQSSMTDSLGSWTSTVAYLSQERVCAAYLDTGEWARVEHEFWSAALEADAWVALSRLVTTDEPRTGSMESTAVAETLRHLLDGAPERTLRTVDPRKRLGYVLALAERWSGLRTVVDLTTAHANDSSPSSDALVELLEAMVEGADLGCPAPVLVRLLHEHVVRGLPDLVKDSDAGERAKIRERMLRLTNRMGLSLEEAVAPGSPEARALTVLLSEHADSAPESDADRETDPSVDAEIELLDTGLARIIGRRPSITADSLAVIARNPAGDVRWVGPAVDAGDRWTAFVDLSRLDVGTDWTLDLHVVDGAGPVVTGLALRRTGNPKGSLRVVVIDGRTVVRHLDAGLVRTRNALAWRVRKLARAATRGRKA
ncbi:glycosyltransferase family 2 protein [Brevibacterium samyangense]|uniref:Glycosyltransferase 2-like domain-containing protein n=1 Tax=Brevibacterium samyangense TaxID=366888 RepID=A0ABN2TP45_9MICO